MNGLDPKIYTKDYYLKDCSGFKEFNKSSGEILYPRLFEITQHLQIKKGTKLLDIGCGRGELAFWAASKGAKVIGVDYSKEAIKLSKRALIKQPKKVQSNVRFFVKNAKELNFEPETFDSILLIDVLEHLYPKEQDIVLKNINKFLKKDGTLIAHTEPNRTFLDYAYPFWSYPISNKLMKIWNYVFHKKHPIFPHPNIMRTQSHKIMHINEPTYLNLAKTFNNCGFESQILTKVSRLREPISWKDRVFNLIVFLDPLSRYFPLNALFADDFIVVAKKK